MGTWNYRIVHYRDDKRGGYGLHEVYYDDAGQPWGMTEDGVRFHSDAEEGPEDIIEALLMATADARNRPVLDEPETWPGKAP